MFCRSCGAAIPSGGAKCLACGQLVTPPLEQDVEAAVRTVVSEVKKLTKDVVREARPAAHKAVAVTRDAVRGAVRGVREAVHEPPPGPPAPPPPGATGDVTAAKKPEPSSTDPASPT